MSAKAGINDLLLKQLIQHFYNGNLNFCLQKDDIDTMNWDFQQAFLDATVNNELLKQYPISGKGQWAQIYGTWYTPPIGMSYIPLDSLYLKKIIQNLEPNQEVHDDFYSQLCTAMNNLNQDGFSYRHYLIGNDTNNIVTIKETRNMVVNGTTGLKTWEAALMLSDWALCNKEIFANKNILELGCGVGFTGITISKLCNVKSLTFTDCHNDVLKTVCENIEINFPHSKQETAHDITMFKNQDKSLSVMMLDWNTIDNLPDNVIPDIVIGADIVYDPSILIPLCNVIKTFCTRNKNLEVYIASVIRNEETFVLFLKTLGNMDLEFEKIQLNKSVLIKWDESIDKCLLKINAKLE